MRAHERGASWSRPRISVGVTVICTAFATGCADEPVTSRDEQPVFAPPYGSGNFGIWIVDRFGLPAYRYTGCDPSHSGCVEPDAIHQLGNDGINALAHANGTVELFTARTFYRFANRYDPDALQLGGGFGWVDDGGERWSTLFSDRPAETSYERVFGMGYYEKTIEHHGLRVEQVIYPPEGDDEALLERVRFVNTSDRPKVIRYFDYWDVAWWLPMRQASGPVSTYDPAHVTTVYDRSRATIEAISLAAAGDPAVPSRDTDPSPKVSFVTCLDGEPAAFDTVEQAFFGDGDRAQPQRVRDGRLGNSLDASGALRNQDAVLVTEHRLRLAPGESRSIHLLYGLADRGTQDQLIDAARRAPAFSLPAIASQWAARVPRVTSAAGSWLGRELAWSYYYLRSGILREDFFDTHVINQGAIYLYGFGANAGPRATLRSLVPLIYTDPDLAKQSLRYGLREMAPSGEIPYATSGHGAWNQMGYRPSDGSLWLLWAALEYIDATRDTGFLDERNDFWCQARRGACGSATAYEMLVRAYAYQRDVVRTGAHGLIRLLASDWDDFMWLLAPDPLTTTIAGESTMNTALALIVYPRLAALAEARGDAATAASVRRDLAALTTAMRAQWRGDHFNRAYVYASPTTPVELGANNLWLASNGPALLAPDLVTGDERGLLVARIERDNYTPSPVGLESIGAPLLLEGTPGNWYALSGPTIEGLLADPRTPGARALAWGAFQRQTFANHAALYPDLWYGIWSGPDMYFTPLEAPLHVGAPGETWCFPQLCMLDLPATDMFSHSEPLLSSLRMAGIRADARGFTIDPAFPGDSFRWATPAFEIDYLPWLAAGALRAVATDNVELRVRRPSALATVSRVIVNGVSVPWTSDGGFVVFRLPLTAGQRVSWALW